MDQRTLLGKYHVIAELGWGGMSEVYLAVVRGPAGFNKLVVVKVLRDDLASQDAKMVDMFLDEARLAARLNHPNVVQTNEVGQSNGLYFLSMEYLEGQNLHSMLKCAQARGQRLPLAMLLRVLSMALEGLHAAHAAKDYDGTPLNVVHRDVSPHNVFVTYEGQVKVVDFGIAKANGRLAEATQLGVLKGKVVYMSPEQVQGDGVDARSDLFSVGVILFDYLARRRLWQGCSDVEILRRLMQRDYPRSPREFAADAPEGLDAICRRALAPEPAERYESARAMQADVDAFLATLGHAPSLRDIGEHVARLFEAERKALSATVERQLALLRGAPNERFVDGASLPHLHAYATSVSSLTVSSTEDVAAPVEFEAERRGPFTPWRKAAFVLAGVAVALVATVVALGLSAGPAPAALAGAPRPGATASAPVEAPPVEAPPVEEARAEPPRAPPASPPKQAANAAPAPPPRWSAPRPARPAAPPKPAPQEPASAPTPQPAPASPPRSTKPDLGY